MEGLKRDGGGKFYGEPNKFTRPAHLSLSSHSATFQGYQEFILTKDAVTVLAVDVALRKTQELLTPFFKPRYLAQRSLVDLRANGGFFSFWARQNGADKVIALDMDDAYLKMMEAARAELGIENIEIVKADVADWHEPADVVLAFALNHWVYSCPSIFCSLDDAVEALAELTNYLLIVEWVDPADPAIDLVHHRDWNQAYAGGPYTPRAFETALACHFARYELIGEVSPTRRLYAAFRTPHEIDFSSPLPLLREKGSVIYGRFQAKHEGVEYWSYIYDDGEVIYKQATRDLAARGAGFLAELGSEHFPRVLSVRSEGMYSVAALEKIRGVPLSDAAAQIASSPGQLHDFINHCLEILKALRRQGILHRDISGQNILVREGKPVLLDFDWAVSLAHPFFTPEGLGRTGQPPDGSYCDVYSMGKVFEQINHGRYPAFDPVIEMMAESNASLRTTDLDTVMVLFAAAAGRPSPDANDPVAHTLLEGIAERNQHLRRLAGEQEQLIRKLGEKQQALVELNGWRERAEAAEEKLEGLRLTVESMVAQAKAKEADWELWLKRHREVDARLGRIERAPVYRLYRALTALVRRFWSIKP